MIAVADAVKASKNRFNEDDDHDFDAMVAQIEKSIDDEICLGVLNHGDARHGMHIALPHSFEMCGSFSTRVKRKLGKMYRQGGWKVKFASSFGRLQIYLYL